MATSRHRASFVDFAHPQVWHKIVEYSEVTVTLTKLMSSFTNQWAKICFLAASQLHQLMNEFRKKTDLEIRGKCPLGGRMYDLWESLLLESELESQALKKMACLMEKEICTPLESFTAAKTRQLSIHREHRHELDEIVAKSHEILQEFQNEYTRAYKSQDVISEWHVAHNDYLLELTGVNGLLSKYQYHTLPQLLQSMETSQIETIDSICQNIQLLASIAQDYEATFHKLSSKSNPL